MKKATCMPMKASAGFTLVELLIVTVLVGILATIAAISTRRAAERAYVAAVQADLKQLATHQELFHHVNMRYGTIDELLEFEATDGVTVAINWVDTGGYAATAIHAALPAARECGYYVGDGGAGQAGPATAERQITCG